MNTRIKLFSYYLFGDSCFNLTFVFKIFLNIELDYKTETGGILDYEDIIAMIKYFISIGKTKADIINHDESRAWHEIVTAFFF